MSRHEVITLQFGSFANFSGAHFWNIQVLIIEPRVGLGDDVVLFEAEPPLISPG